MDTHTTIETIKNVEKLLGTFPFDDELATIIRSNVVENIHSHSKKQKKHIKYEDRLIAQKIEESKEFSKENEVLFTMADEGNVTVAMKYEMYKDKMYDLLSDNDTYVPVNSNPLGSLQKNVKELLYKWNEQGYLGRVYHRFALTQTDTALSKIYGLPKIHKEGVPLRPIVSAVNSPTYFLSKTVDKILKACLSKAESYIKNSHFISQVTKIKVPRDHIGFSLDIKALFPSTPLDLTVQAVEKRFCYIRERHDITLQELIDAIKFLMENTYFTYEGKVYHQIHGTPMGSPVSPTFSDLVMMAFKLVVQLYRKLPA
ncbi:hypothetical protein QAD02_021199 [Eretmocerus hayati]|uniref:Uncharacterized protein n=1 Tax=Eretmocerus hayati TaxID=131215 RepID=A0ACC2PRG6_9HYME|nr:hypothetical protein QAD02_021199 [Eretmocerus hayati]